MACGLPVIATDVGGNSELIEAGKTGVVVPAGDVPAMAREIIGLAKQREKARTMGLDGRKRVEQTFSMTAMVKQYQDLYDRCLKR